MLLPKTPYLVYYVLFSPHWFEKEYRVYYRRRRLPPQPNHDEFFSNFFPLLFSRLSTFAFFSPVRVFKTRLTGGPVLLRVCAPAARSSCRYSCCRSDQLDARLGAPRRWLAAHMCGKLSRALAFHIIIIVDKLRVYKVRIKYTCLPVKHTVGMGHTTVAEIHFVLIIIFFFADYWCVKDR